MNLSVGIVGLPNVGKSTLFNALLKKQAALVANYPFATIEPNVGIVPVPDDRLEALAQIYRAPVVPATVKFVDIAGLIKGSHRGEGLGNKFLSHIRETDAVCHVLRAFTDPDVVRQGVVDPKTDFDTVTTELALADLETVDRHRQKKTPDESALPLLAKKPILVALNIDEKDLARTAALEQDAARQLSLRPDQIVAICAKTEAELAGFLPAEQQAYLRELGQEKSGLDRLVKKAFTALGLITFLTAGEKEVRAWTISEGTDAVTAAGVIHTDFIANFIRAEVVELTDFLSLGGWKNCRRQGKTRFEGRDYRLKDGEVVEFKIGR